MEIKLSVEELRKNKLFIATPCYGGQCTGLYMKSCLDLQNTMNHYGVETKFSFLFNESLIQRARNYLADEFLRSDFTHLLFIDADIEFNPQDIIAMLALDKDIIGAPYPKKSVNWSNIKAAILKNPEINPGELENLVGEYVFNVVKGTTQFAVTEPLEVMEIGTGYMLIKRQVFDKIREEVPELAYTPDHVGQKNFDGSRQIHSYFSVEIDSKDSIIGGGSMRLLSEDYFFCQLFRKLGGRIYLCPWIKSNHIGTFTFRGDMPAVANYSGKL